MERVQSLGGKSRKSRSPELSVQVDLQHAKQQVWMRLEGTLSSATAHGLAQRISDSLARSKSRLVLDLKKLRWDKAEDLRTLREKLSPNRSRIRLILPNLSAAHPELLLLASVFQHYRGLNGAGARVCNPQQRPHPAVLLWIERNRGPVCWQAEMAVPDSRVLSERRYSTGELVRRLLGLAWQFRGDCLWSLALSVMLLLLGPGGLAVAGRWSLMSSATRWTRRSAPPAYPFGWTPPAGWTPLHIVTAMALAIVVQAVLRAVLTYQYNMITARLTQGKIVPDLRDRMYAKLQRLSFRFFDVHGSSSIFNRVTGDVQNTRLFVDGVVLQGVNMLLTLAAYFVFMWRIHAEADGGLPVGDRRAVVGDALLLGAAAAGLPAQPRAL